MVGTGQISRLNARCSPITNFTCQPCNKNKIEASQKCKTLIFLYSECELRGLGEDETRYEAYVLALYT